MVIVAVMNFVTEILAVMRKAVVPSLESAYQDQVTMVTTGLAINVSARKIINAAGLIHGGKFCLSTRSMHLSISDVHLIPSLRYP